MLSETEEAGAEEAARHLAHCADCRERLRVMVCLAGLLPAAGHSTVSADGIGDDAHPAAPGRFRVARRLRAGWWLAAAAVLAGLILSVPHPDLPAPRRDSLSTRSAYPRFPLRTRSRAVRPNRRELGLQAYMEGDFEEAARRLLGIDDAESWFFLGVSLHLSGRPREALTWLNRAQRDPRWRRPALWYQANALLDMGRIGEAKMILLDLAAADGEFRKESRDLLGRPALRDARPKEDG